VPIVLFINCLHDGTNGQQAPRQTVVDAPAPIAHVINKKRSEQSIQF